MAWAFFYLIIAATFQVAWLYNVKGLKKEKLKQVRLSNFFSAASLKALLPLVLYIVFGLSNVVFLTWAMKDIPPSLVYAIWTGLVIGSATLIDRWVFKQEASFLTYIFIACITAGIIGLKTSMK